MNNETISVIVTVFNREKLLDRCIRSILDQTEVQTELLLIDDGSTDRSFEICKSYESRFNNVKVFKQANGGISRARNVGLDNATGDYIVFLDDDDCMTPGSLKVMLDAMHTYDVDFVAGNFEKQEENGDFICKCHLPDSAKNRVLTEDEYWEASTDRKGYFIFIVNWAKLYKKSIWETLRFPEEYKRSEDEYVLCDILEKCQKIYMTDYVVYRQTMTKKSITRKSACVSMHIPPETKLVTASKLIARKKYRYAVYKWGIACGEIIAFTQKAPNKDVLNSMNKLYKESCSQGSFLFRFFDFKKKAKYMCYKLYFPLLKCYKQFNLLF